MALDGVGALAGSVGQLISLYRAYQASTIAATIATKGFTGAIMANPLGLAIIGVTTLGAVLLPLIAATNDATDATDEYADALREVRDLSEKSTETIEGEIEALKKKEQEILANIEALKTQNVIVDRGTIATRQATQATGWHKLATGELTENRAAQAIRDTELQTRRLADGAKTAYEQASKAVSAHQRKVTDLQKEYNELKETIDKALGIDEEIEDAEREIERADIRKIRAERDLADLQEEIKKKEVEARSGDADAKRELEELHLREREAVLDVADAQDRYQDALDESSAKQAEKVEVEKALNGESVSSAQERLDEIGRMLEEEQEKLDVALEKREEAQVAHENLMSEIENEALDVKSANWAEYVKYVNDNPAIARTYHVEYDENGNPIGGLPQIPKLDIQTPSYASPAFAAASESTAAVASRGGGSAEGSAGAAAATTGLNLPAAGAAGGMAVTINQNVYTQTQSASEVQAATERGLRDAALEGSL